MAELETPLAIADTNTVKLSKDNAVYALFSILSLGTAVGMVYTFEWSPDGVLWFLLSCTPMEGGAAATTRNTAGGSYAVTPGATHVRLRLSALASGAPGKWRIDSVDS